MPAPPRSNDQNDYWRPTRFVLPILEQGEQEGSHYLSFLAMLRQHADPQLFEGIPEEFQGSTLGLRDQIGALLPAIPEPLRSHRISEAIAFSVHTSAHRERAQVAGLNVLPFAVHVTDLLDGLVGFLEAPVSAATLDALHHNDLTPVDAHLPF